MKDNLGIFFSALCIIHCLLMPILAAVGLISLVKFDIESPIIHITLLLPVIFFAVSSLPASKKMHESMTPSILAFLGISLMLVTLFLPEECELWVMLVAGTLVVTAHLLNKHLLFSQQLISAE
jgi:4-amino-4-deoxy-L-arabinose transferase-like glycosyltransferase